MTLVFCVVIVSAVSFTSTPWPRNEIFAPYTSVEERGGVLYVNPGSTGPRRFKLPVSVARMSVVDGRQPAQIVEVGAASA